TTSPKLKKIVGSIRSKKAPLDLAKVDKAAAAIKHAADRAWFDVCRFMGLRLDECNRLQWSDINFDIGEIHIRGSKTEGSDEWLPVAPVVLETLKRLKESREDQNCSWVFPGRAHQTKGKKVYDRRHVFEQIEADTGIHLKAKDLRDYFATEIANKVNDPATVMKLLRHSNLRTTSIYLRTVKTRMRDALKDLGATDNGLSVTENSAVNPGGYSRGRFDGNGLPETVPNGITPEVIALAKLLYSQG